MKIKKIFLNIAQYIPQVLVLLSVLTSNIFFPVVALAEEVNDLQSTNTQVDIPVDESEDILDEGISTSIFEEEEANEPRFVFENGVYTVNSVVVGEEYVYPDNQNVRVVFNEITEEGNLVIKRIELTQEEKELLNTSDDYGWDITSSMNNGSFKYDLTLPNIHGNDVEVKYTEDGKEYESIDSVIVNEDVIEIEGLDHFTMFVVVSPITVPVGGDCTVMIAGANRTGRCYPTIQAAINNAGNGDTIYVAEGEYPEYLSINQEAISIIGDGADSTIIRPNTGGAVITINNDHTTTPMTIEGFTIDAANTGSGIFIQNETSNVTVKNNKVINFTEKGVLISNGDNNSVLNNTIISSTSGANAGVYVDNGSENNTINGNTITLPTIPNTPGVTPLNYDIWFTGGITGVNTITENTLLGGAKSFQQDSSVTGTTTFSNNTIGETISPSWAGVSINGGSANITGNFIKDSVRPIEFTGSGTITITDNTIDGTYYDFINIGSGFTGTINPIQHNSFLNMGDADLNNRTTKAVNATENYWGDLDPSNNINNSGDGSIDYSPWWGEDYVESDHSSIAWTWYTNDSIQDAINIASSGDIINVTAGTYQEQVVINKNLTLHGMGNPVIKAPDSPVIFTFSESSKQWEPVVFAFGGTETSGNVSGEDTIAVTITGFTVDGNNREPDQRSAGILLRNINGIISNNTVRNMLIDGKETFGIVVHGNSDVVITENNVSGYARGGIVANGDSNGTNPSVYLTPNATITNNTVIGPGMGVPVTWAPNGIQIGWGATGKIIGNTVSGNGWPGTDWTGSGILVATSNNVEIDNNTVVGNETGIAIQGYMWASNGIPTNDTWIHDNTIDGNTYGISIQDKSVDTIIENNTIKNSTYDGIDICNFEGYPPTGTVIRSNTITGNNTENDGTSGGIWIDDGVDGDEVKINLNNIANNNQTGILNTSTFNAVDAIQNWWGDASGPKDTVSGDNSILDTNPSGIGSAVIGAVKYSPWYKDEGMTILSNEPPSIPTGLTAKFQNDSQNLPNGSTINITAKPNGNNLELLWQPNPIDLVTGYRILGTFPDGTTNLSYQGPNTNAWLKTYNGFGAHGNGRYSYQVIAVNANGTSDPSEPFVIYYDTHIPTAELISAPADNSYVKGDFDVEGIADDNVALRSVFFDVRTQNGGTWKSGCKSGTTVLTYSDDHKHADISCTIDTRNLVNGTTYMLRIHAGDNAGYGNVNSEAIRYFTMDTEKPTVSFEGLRHYDYRYPSVPVDTTKTSTSDNTPIVLISASDSLSGISSVTVNGQTAVYDGSTYWVVELTSLPEGTNTLEIVGIDNAGNAETVFQEIFIDTNPPTAIYTHYNNEIAIDEIANPITYVKGINQLSFTAQYTDITPSSGLYQDSFVIFEAQNDGSFGFSADGKKAYCTWRKSPNLIENLTGSTYNLENKIEFTECIESLPNGEYYIAHQVYDNATRWDIPTINQFRDVLGLRFVVDAKEPVISIIPSRVPDIGKWYSTRPSYNNTYPTFTISAIDTNLDKVEYKWDEGSWDEYEGGDILYEDEVDGKHILYARATDLAGNITEEELEVWFDFSNPEGTFTTDDTDRLVRQAVTLNFTNVQDPSGSEEINRIEVWVDGYGYIGNATEISEGVYEYSLDTTQLSNGEHIVRPSIFDMAGNRTRPFVKITVDNTSPSIPELVFPQEGQYLNANALYIDWNESEDNYTDPNNIVYEYRLYSKNPVDFANASYYSVLYTGTTRHPNTGFASGTGEHEFWYTVQAIDEAGNESGFAQAKRFVVDNTAPVSSINIIGNLDETKNLNHNNGWHGDGWYYDFTKVKLSITSGSELDENEKIQYEILTGDKTCTTLTNPTEITSGTNIAGIVNGKGDGIYTLCYQAKDSAGNLESVKREVLKLDRTKPEYEILTNTINGTEVNGVYYISSDTIEVDVQGEDVHSGYFRTRYDLFEADENWNCSNRTPNSVDLPDAINDKTQTLSLSGLEDGRYCMQIWVYDDVQNKSWTDVEGLSTIHFVIDTQAPQPPVLTGDPIQYVKWGNVTRSWLASSSSDVDYYMYKNITNNWTAGPYDAGEERYDITHSTGNYNRIFEWQVAAVDYAGNETWSNETYKVVVDGTKPTVEITNVNITDKKLSFTVSGIDNLSGARTVGTNIYNESNTGSAVIEIGRLAHDITPETLNVSYNATDIDISELESGTYTIRASIRDYSENIEYATYQVDVDNTPPIIAGHSNMTLIEGELFPTDTVTLTDDYGELDQVCAKAEDLTGTLGDSDYQCVSINPSNYTSNQFSLADEIRKAIENWQDMTEGSFNTIDLDVLPEGQYQIDYYATDKAGNESDVQTFTVTIQDNIPTITIDQTDMDVLAGSSVITLTTTVTNGNSPFTYVWLGGCIGTEDQATFNPTTEGLYTCTVTVTDADGDTSTDSVDITVGAVAGASTTESTRVYALSQTSEGGTGAGSELTDEEQPIPEEEVLGEDILTCENPIQVNGYIYLDKNKNDLMDENEKGIAGISITITGIYKENKITIDTLETDEKGYYEIELCPDTYTLTIDKNDLPKNTEIEEVLSLEIKEDTKEPIQYNIPAIDTRNFWQKYWYLILIAGALGITTVYLIATGKKKEQEN
jgi:parallel beta-helix repeat protein